MLRWLKSECSESSRDFENVPLSQVGSNKKAAMQLEAKFFFRISLLLSDSSGFSWVFLGVSGYIGYHLSFGGNNPILRHSLRDFRDAGCFNTVSI